MKIVRNIVVGISFLSLVGCNSEPTMQKYFVEKSENKNFIALDLSPAILNLKEAKLSDAEKKALKSFNKMNILAFKSNSKNTAEFEAERNKVNLIMKNPQYQLLMKFGSGKDGGSVSYVGADNYIEEFVLYGNKKDTGFGIIRILGKDMNANNIMTFVMMLQKSNLNLEELKPLQELFKK